MTNKLLMVKNKSRNSKAVGEFVEEDPTAEGRSETFSAKKAPIIPKDKKKSKSKANRR